MLFTIQAFLEDYLKKRNINDSDGYSLRVANLYYHHRATLDKAKFLRRLRAIKTLLFATNPIENRSLFEDELLRRLDGLFKKKATAHDGTQTNGILDETRILFLAADPTNTNAAQLRLGEEEREIQEKLQLAKLRQQFDLRSRFAVRPQDISQALLDFRPQIVHFSGHGTSSGSLCFENQIGEIKTVEPDALAALFAQFSGEIVCVVLNACYSELQARAIAQHIQFVIGMNQSIGDKAAIAFSIGFYQALGAGRSIQQAYDLGVVQIRLQGIAEHLTPVLIVRA